MAFEVAEGLKLIVRIINVLNKSFRGASCQLFLGFKQIATLLEVLKLRFLDLLRHSTEQKFQFHLIVLIQQLIYISIRVIFSRNWYCFS